MTFALQIQDATQLKRIDHVSAFVGEDVSGSFGLLSGHARFMTSLVIGLSRFRVAQGAWQYLAMPGGLLYFQNNVLTLNTRHFLLDENYARISVALQQQIIAEEQALHAMKQSLHRLEEEALRRLWRLGLRDV